ncbi:MAG: DUF3014 domain-containing protein [Steroidobacteraceae bacterium]|jgi:hypothetical protein
MNRPLIGLVILVIAGAIGGGWYYWRSSRAQPAPVTMAVEAPPPPAAPQEAAPVHPVPEAGPDFGNAPLPALNDSDPAIRNALDQVFGAATVMQYLAPENIIRRIVVTVDNLARQKAPLQQRPVGTAPGAFIAAGDELHASIDPKNYARYQPMVSVIRNLDLQRLTALYVHFYPLFQRSYEDLGYPNAYFNDRLVEVIDILLATPTPAAPPELVRPNVMYLYADPAIEARPAGQKLLMRMGADNAKAVKAKLMELRAAVTAAPIKHK